MKNSIIVHDEIYNFALRLAIAIDDLKSNHAYFIVQKAFGEISWGNVGELTSTVINKCSCKDCKKVKKEVINRFKSEL